MLKKRYVRSSQPKRPFLLPHSALVMSPASWGGGDIAKVERTAALLREAAEIVRTGADSGEIVRRAAEELRGRPETSEEIPATARDADRLFGIGRVDGDPVSALACAGTIAVCELLALCGPRERSVDGRARESLGLTIAHLGNAVAGLATVLRGGNLARASLPLCSTEPRANRAGNACPWAKLTRRIESALGSLAPVLPGGRSLIARWIAAHRLFYVLLQALAMCLLAAKRVPRAGREDLAIPLLMSAGAIFSDCRDLFSLATPKGIVYRLTVRPWTIRFVPTISGADAGDHGAFMAALRSEPWPNQAGLAFGMAQQSVLNAYSAAFASHAQICRQAVASRASARSANTRAASGARPAKSGPEVLEALKNVRLQQMAAPASRPPRPVGAETPAEETAVV
jgi:hypothetical protein